jgi:type I restriction enzyme R subunit
VDFDSPGRNDWLAVNQFSVLKPDKIHHRIPDVVVFVNGLPLGVFELKNPTDAKRTARDAFKDLQLYKDPGEIERLFHYNALLVASDGVDSKIGTVSSGWERFSPWRTIEGVDVAPSTIPTMEVLVKGVFDPRRFLDLVRFFIVFEETRAGIVKKVAGYHQFHAVRKAIERTVKAVRGDRRVGVVWHTQGAGKSLLMVFYAGMLARHEKMENPTIVVLTDRNDLDDQLFATFSNCHDLLRQKPVQAGSRAHLRELLRKTASGGIYFTTIQKFLPEVKGDTQPKLSDRRNIVVIADEAHRSQYDFIDGFARNMRDALPYASFIGFTATPLEKADRSTPAVFGDYIDVYDVYQAIEDKATVPIYYEGRLAKLELNEAERPKVDPEFEEITEDELERVREDLKRKWSRLEALVGAEKRVNLLARDIVDHFEKRREVMEGKGLVVCMSRRICVSLHDAIRKLRPRWYDKDDKKGSMKIVMTGSGKDRASWQEHTRDKDRRQAIGDCFKDAKDPLKLVIVRDMWLTGFDVPSLHTMYIDKPMRGHGLMQAIARVNRVFKDKPGGLVVDYIGIAHELRAALAEDSKRDRETTGIDQEKAVEVLLEKIEVIEAMYHGFDYSGFFGKDAKKRTLIIQAAADHIVKLEKGKDRYLQVVTEMSRAFALSVPNEKALALREKVGFFQAVRAFISKNTKVGKDPDDLDTAVQQIVSKAVSSDEVIDIFGAAKMKNPDISVLSEEFLQEVRGMKHRNLAAEALMKLLNDEIKARTKRNLIQSRTFLQKLEEAIRKYHNRALDAVQVIEELINLARAMREAAKRGEKLRLTEEELAFYDALGTSDSAVAVLGEKGLRAIAQELTETIRRNVSIDWVYRENVKAKMRTMVKRVLRKHNYPPDKTEKATLTVLEQAELLCRDWAPEAAAG